MTSITAQQWVTDQMRQLASNCLSAATRIHQAQSMRQVVEAARVHVRPEIRTLARSMPELRKLIFVAEKRLEELLNEHLAELRKAETHDEARMLKGKFMSRDWAYLRGDYSRILAIASRESTRILWSKEKHED